MSDKEIIVTRQTSAPLESLRLSPTHEPLFQLVSQWRRGVLDPNPPYQRGSVWTLDQRINLIHSFLTGVPVPAIVTNRRGGRGNERTRYVIDGKQRIITARMWFEGKFAVPASWFPPEHLADTFTIEPGSVQAAKYGDTGEYVRFTGLSDEGQRVFEGTTSVLVAEGRLPTEQAEAEVYLRVNGYGTQQTAEDMANAARVAGHS